MSLIESVRYRRFRTVFIACLFVMIGACTGSGSEFSLVASETMADSEEPLGFAFAGEEVTGGAPTLTVQAGEEVTVTLENAHGQYSSVIDSHDFAVVPKLDDIPTLAATRALDDEVLWGASIDKLFADESGSVTFTPDNPGTYYYLCTLPGHADNGMIGEFVVEP